MALNIYNKSCYDLTEVLDSSIDSIISDPPYGIDIAEWDKVPDSKIWKDCYRALKPGGYMAVFTSIKTLHLFTKDILDAGFQHIDTLNWVYLNGSAPKTDIDARLDKAQGVEREITGYYKYKQGTPTEGKKSDSYTLDAPKAKTRATSDLAKSWEGFGRGLKTAYEPILLVQKPLEGDVAENIIKWGVGALNLEECRVPYGDDEDGTTVGHNPHPKGRIMADIVQTEEFGDYQRFFFVSKVRDGKKTGNHHPTVKPTPIMDVLVKLLSRPGQMILDPFMGSGTTGVSAKQLGRDFTGYEISPEYFEIVKKRLEDA